MTLLLFLKFVAHCKVEIFGYNAYADKIYTLLYCGDSKNVARCKRDFLERPLLWVEPCISGNKCVLRIFVDLNTNEHVIPCCFYVTD